MNDNEEILALHRQLAAERLRADRAETRSDAKSRECIELRERMAAPAAPEQVRAVSVPRSTLLMIYEAMNHMGDILNDMDACEDDDEEATTPAFDAIRALLDDSPFAAPSAAAPAAPSLTDEEITDAVFGTYLSDFDDARAYDIAIVRAALAALTKKSQAAPAAPEQWISTSERMPEDGETVRILCPNPTPEAWDAKWNAGSQTFESKANGWVRGDEVSHWTAKSAAPEQDEVRNQALEDAAQMLLNGRFLHDEAPPKLFAKEAAAAIRKMKTATNEGEARDE